MAAVFGLAFGALLEGGGEPSQAASKQPEVKASARSKVALPTPTASARDRPSPDYGFALEVVERSGASFLVFDRADILVGAPATAEAARNGATVDPDGGYYVRNNNKRERRLRIADEAQINGGDALGGSDGGMSMAEFAQALDDADEPVPVLLTYDDADRVATVVETRLP